MNEKGFAISGILYSILVLFLVLISIMLFNLQNKKTLLDKLKSDTVEAIEGESTYEYILSEINNLKQNQLSINDIYPVGSIYISATEDTVEKVQTKFGGTWEKYAQGKTIIGEGTGTDSNNVNQTFSANSTGGEYAHTLTVDEMPSHSHNYQTYAPIMIYNPNGGNVAGLGSILNGSNTPLTIQNTGGSQSHNNLQPYITVYMYKRIA